MSFDTRHTYVAGVNPRDSLADSLIPGVGIAGVCGWGSNYQSCGQALRRGRTS